MIMKNESMFESAGRLFFTRERIRKLEKEINTAGITMPADSFAGYMALNVIVITIFLTALLSLFQPLSEGITGLVSQYIQLPFAVIFHYLPEFL